MESDIEKLISLQMQTAKLVLLRSHTSFEEKVTTALQLQALSYLSKNPASTLSSLAQFLEESHSSATQLVERMEKAGFIKREGDPNDRRLTHLSLTEKGKENLKQTKEKRINQFKKIYSLIDKKDVKELIRIQEKLLEGLRKDDK